MHYLCADVCGQAIHVNDDIKNWLAGIRIKVCDAFAELVNVVGEQLIRIRYSIIQIGHFVISEPSVKIKVKIKKVVQVKSAIPHRNVNGC